MSGREAKNEKNEKLKSGRFDFRGCLIHPTRFWGIWPHFRHVKQSNQTFFFVLIGMAIFHFLHARSSSVDFLLVSGRQKSAARLNASRLRGETMRSFRGHTQCPRCIFFSFLDFFVLLHYFGHFYLD